MYGPMITFVYRTIKEESADWKRAGKSDAEIVDWLCKVLEISYSEACKVINQSKRKEFSTNKLILTVSERQFTRFASFRCIDNLMRYFKSPVIISYVEEPTDPTLDISKCR